MEAYQAARAGMATDESYRDQLTMLNWELKKIDAWIDEKPEVIRPKRRGN